MPVIPLTLTISLCLVFTFVIFFLCEHARGRTGSAEHASLLPLAEETPRPVHAAPAAGAAAADHPADDGCGCSSGRKAPCPGCRARHPAA
jgi:hypothetical protein